MELKNVRCWTFPICMIKYDKRTTKKRLGSIYFIEDLPWTLKLQKAQRCEMRWKRMEMERKTHAQRANEKNSTNLLISFQILFVSISLCFSFRFYSSTKFMSINSRIRFHFVQLLFSRSIIIHTLEFSFVPFHSSNEVKEFCFCSG